MEATLNLNNYTDKEILDLFGISEQDCKNKSIIKKLNIFFICFNFKTYFINFIFRNIFFFRD